MESIAGYSFPCIGRPLTAEAVTNRHPPLRLSSQRAPRTLAVGIRASRSFSGPGPRKVDGTVFSWASVAVGQRWVYRFNEKINISDLFFLLLNRFDLGRFIKTAF
ncbi:hypothetical protein [Pseudomonas delhiensis]|uniref:hypothetical protein n=1 Tax=Pseudomonas delhiensis TaxID=366289 RepID=UPI00315A810F